MLKVVVAIVVLLGIVLIRQIPKIGGNIHAALLAAGVATMLCAGMLNPGDWLVAWVDGINRIAWIMALSITGGIFAEISQELGTVDTIIGVLNAKFGQKPRALIVSIIFVLVVAGSLLGDAVAAATVIGALTIGVLVSMNIKLELISSSINRTPVSASAAPAPVRRIKANPHSTTENSLCFIVVPPYFKNKKTKVTSCNFCNHIVTDLPFCFQWQYCP